MIAAGPDLIGPVWPRLALVLGTATYSWAITGTANLSLTGVTTGAGGAGAVAGKVFIVPAPLPVNAAAASAGLLGMDAARLARAVGVGLAVAFNASGQYVGVSSGVGAGVDVSKIVFANGPSLVGIITATAASQGLAGPDIPRLAGALGTGIAALMLTGTGAGVVAGPAGPAPTVGTSISQVF
jgi:hypothetical protein